MIKNPKNTAMTGEEKRVKQKFHFPPQDGIDTPTEVEADTIEEAESEFRKIIKQA